MRYASLTGRWFIAAAALLAGAWSAGVAAANASSPSHVVQQRVQSSAMPALVEVPECWGSVMSPATTLPGANVETITLTIEPTSLVKVDERGRVLAAETNTGCAPRRGDHVYVVHQDGTLEDAPTFDVALVRWTGDFTQFGYQLQTGG